MLISTIWSEQKPQLVLIPLVILALLLAPNFMTDALTLTMVGFLSYAILTLAWSMFSAPTNLVSLATAGLFGIGVYICAALRGSLPIEVIMLVAGGVAFLVALAMGMLTLRLRGVYFILFTFGVTALIQSAVQWWETSVNGIVGRTVSGATPGVAYLLLAILFSITLVSAFLLRNSSIGLALNGIGQNQDATEHVGVNVTRLKVLVFALTAFLIGATGAVMATRMRYVQPVSAFNPTYSFFPVVMAIFGGTSRLYGPIVGTAVLFILRDFMVTEHPYLYMLIFGLVLIVVVLWLPGGLVEQIEKGMFRIKVWWAKFKMWFTKQRRLIGIRRARR